MAQKCVHKGCGKVFSDPEEPCVYHPGYVRDLSGRVRIVETDPTFSLDLQSFTKGRKVGLTPSPKL